MIQDGPQPKDVGVRPEKTGMPFGLLRGHIGEGAGDDALLGWADFPPRLGQACQTEVDQTRFACRVDEDIGGLEVSMDHAMPMDAGKSPSQVGCQGRRLFERHPFPFEDLVEGSAGNIRHDEEGPSLVQVRVVQLHQARIVQLRLNSRLV